MRLHNLPNGTDKILGSHEKPIKCVEYAPSSGVVVTGSWDETMKLWDSRTSSPCIGVYKQPGQQFLLQNPKQK